MTEPGSFQVPGQESMGTNWNTRSSFWTSGSSSCCVCDRALVQGVQRGCRVSFLEIFDGHMNMVLGSNGIFKESILKVSTVE